MSPHILGKTESEGEDDALHSEAAVQGYADGHICGDGRGPYVSSPLRHIWFLPSTENAVGLEISLVGHRR